MKIIKKVYNKYHEENTATIKKYLENWKKKPQSEQDLCNEISSLMNSVKNDVISFQDEIKSKVLQQKQSSIKWPKKISDMIPSLLAKIFALYTLQNSQFYFEDESGDTAFLFQPHIAQVLSIFRMLGIAISDKILCNNLAEIGTGEGKSITLAACSIILALFGFEVYCVCYSKYLWERDYNFFKSFFEKLQVTDNIHYGTFQLLCEKMINDKCNDLRQTVIDLYLGAGKKISISNDNKIKIILIDEVDVFFSKEFYGEVYVPEASLSHKQITEFIYFLWEQRKIKKNIGFNSISQTKEFKNCLEIFKPNTYIFEEAAKSMIADLKTFEKHNYLVKDNKIQYKEQDGYVDNMTIGYKTLFAYLFEIEQNRLKNDNELNNILSKFLSLSIYCGEFSYAELPLKPNFAFIMGVSGTLKTLNEFQKSIIKNTYQINLNSYMPSVYGDRDNKLTFNQKNDIKIFKTKQDYFMNLRDEITTQMGSNSTARAILMVFENEEKMMDFYNSEHFKDHKSNSFRLSEKNSKIEIDQIVKSAATQGKITLITRSFGRGTDFVCFDEKLKKNGGMHVIQTFFSVEVSEEVQIKGRTARQGEQGSFSMVLLSIDLEAFEVNQKDIDDNRGNFYKFLDNKRKERNKIENDVVLKTVEDSHKRHTFSLEFLNNLKEGKNKEMHSYLMQLNKSFAIADDEKPMSNTIIMLDGTGSMSSIIEQTKNTICKTFDDIFEVLKEKKLKENCFSILIVVYRNYNADESKILEVSSWENSALNLKKFMGTICADYGWGNEAIELAFWYANSLINQEEKISQIVLIGDAAPNSQDEVLQKRSSLTETYWKSTKFNMPTFYEIELNKIVANNVIVNTFYLTEGNKPSFQEIAKKGKGICQFLDVKNSGANVLTETFVTFILQDVGKKAGMGNELVEIYNKKIKGGYK